jgi:hypothetical protein
MLKSIDRSRTLSAGPRRRAHLQLESLERRDQPDGAQSIPDGAPSILNFAAQELANGEYQITGVVLDANPSGLTVTFGGDYAISGQTTLTNSNGTFSMLVNLQATDMNAGLIKAETVDGQGQVSQPVQLTVNLPPVIIDFNAQEIGNGLFQITGTVIDANPAHLTIALGGDTEACGQTTVTNENGSFSMLVQLPVDGTGSGFITATTVDSEGLQSPQVQVFVTPTPP